MVYAAASRFFPTSHVQVVLSVVLSGVASNTTLSTLRVDLTFVVAARYVALVAQPASHCR